MKISENFNKFKDQALDNWPVKAACLLIALCIYIFYTLSIQDTRSFTVPLSVQSTNGIAIAGSYPKKVKVTLKGKTEEIASLRESEFKAYLDLNYLSKDGKYKVPVTVDAPKSALLLDTLQVSVSPESVNVTVEEQISGWVKVQPLTSGEPAHGYQIKKITVSPEEIEIYGPRSMVLNCHRVQTQVVSVKNAEVSFEQQVIPENLGSFLKATSKDKISVEVEIVPVEGTKKIDNLTVNFENVAPDLEISATPSVVSMTIGGNEIDLEKFLVSKEIAKVNLSEITEEGIYELPVEYAVPPAFTVQESVKTVKVEVKKIILQPEETPAPVEETEDVQE